ncbi:alpha/beta hydrolase [Actinomadura rupiterrae]|uniref:alpha/beta hydrolase n=1 Tax=Actinomadura rupiterrae TaxID=559627 RepID=UPI0020A58354|nr:alpha/beta hydrolase-fold protein [Actinomadura rupiterrae]MCP2338203.1 enterochelin esterase-like enzyme [Actinomadura rupiterrae]
MGPHSTVTLLLAVFLAVLAFAGCMAVWNRIPGPGALRHIGRAGMIVCCQITALALVGLLINNARGFYGTWAEVSADFLGTSFDDGGGMQSTVGGGGGGKGAGMVGRGPLTQKHFKVDTGRKSMEAKFTGPASHVTGRVVIYLPPGYKQDATATYPVVQLFGGTPGEPTTWYGDLNVGNQLDRMIRDGKSKPFILVSASINVAGGKPNECTDIPGQVPVATWLTRDVRDFMYQNFRVKTDAASWATMGYSEGAYCAVKFPLQHPNLYKAGVGIAGTYESTNPSILHNPKLLKANAPYELLAKSPAVKMLLTTGGKDPEAPPAEIDKFLGHVRPPTEATKYTTKLGEHGTVVWRNMLPFIFGWLNKQVS